MNTYTPAPKLAAAALPLAATRAGNGNPITAPKQLAVAKARGFVALPSGPRTVGAVRARPVAASRPVQAGRLCF